MAEHELKQAFPMEPKHEAVYGQSIDARYASTENFYASIVRRVAQSNPRVWPDFAFPYLRVLLTLAVIYRFLDTGSLDQRLLLDGEHTSQALWTLLPINAPMIILTLSFAIIEIISFSRSGKVAGPPSISPSFLLGMGSVLDVGGNSFSVTSSATDSDEVALSEDWAAVGDDIEAGLRIFRWRTVYEQKASLPSV